MAISYVATGAWAFSSSTSTAAAPAMPAGFAAGDLLLLAVHWKQKTATLTTPSGWTRLGTSGVSTNGAGYGTGTGDTAVAIFYLISTTGAESAPTISALTGGSTNNTSGNVMGAKISAWRNAVGLWDIDYAYSQENTSSTSWSVPFAAIDITAGDQLIFSYSAAISTATPSAPGTSGGAGLTVNWVAPVGDGTKSSSGIGADISTMNYRSSSVTGSTSSALTWTLTQSVATYGAVCMIRLREQALAAPSAPTGVAVAVGKYAGTGRALLTWTDDTTGVPTATYNLQFSSNGSSWSTGSTAPAGQESGFITNLTNGNLYYFRVQATNSQGTAASSSVTDTPSPYLTANNAEGGSHGTTVTNGNSGGASGDAFGGVVGVGWTFTNSPARDTLAYALGSGTSPSTVQIFSNVLPYAASMFTRFYCRWSATPTTNSMPIFYPNITAGPAVVITTASKLQISTGTASTATFSIDTWYRFEVSTTSTQVIARAYLGDSTALIEEVTFTHGSSRSTVSPRFGHASGLTFGAGTAYYDDMANSDEGWIGPVLTVSPVRRIGKFLAPQ